MRLPVMNWRRIFRHPGSRRVADPATTLPVGRIYELFVLGRKDSFRVGRGQDVHAGGAGLVRVVPAKVCLPWCGNDK